MRKALLKSYWNLDNSFIIFPVGQIFKINFRINNSTNSQFSISLLIRTCGFTSRELIHVKNVYLRFVDQIALSAFTDTEHRMPANTLQCLQADSCLVCTYDLSRQRDLIYFAINEDKPIQATLQANSAQF